MGETNRPDAMHLRSLTIQNVRAFADEQHLELTGKDGRSNRWCLILGENGVGKTTLLQTLAVMRPIPGFAKEPTADGSDVGTPDRAQAALSLSENDVMRRLVRLKGGGSTSINASFETHDQQEITIGVDLDLDAEGGIQEVRLTKAEYQLLSEGPLVIGYGAGRHIGHDNQGLVAGRHSTWSLFSDAVDLYDAEEIIGQLDHASARGKFKERDKERYDQVLSAVASLLPKVTTADIDFRGPRLPGRSASDCGVHITTPSGAIPLAELSLGYQGVFAWTVDLAYRMLNAYPDSPRPLHESAIVLIDEIDLHLHPRWQRGLREHLLEHFPNIQFIATTHSPITAQEAVANEGTVAVVRWENDGAVIVNDPLPDREWGYDQILTSELFGFGVARSEKAEGLLDERVSLVRTLNRTPQQEERLVELEGIIGDMPSMRSDIEREFENLMKAFKDAIPSTTVP